VCSCILMPRVHSTPLCAQHDWNRPPLCQVVPLAQRAVIRAQIIARPAASERAQSSAHSQIQPVIFAIPADGTEAEFLGHFLEFIHLMPLSGVAMHFHQQYREPFELPGVGLVNDLPFGAFAIHFEQIKITFNSAQPT
jgi:hypothetical protein